MPDVVHTALGVFVRTDNRHNTSVDVGGGRREYKWVTAYRNAEQHLFVWVYYHNGRVIVS